MRILTLLLALFFALPAGAKPLIADMSNYRIEINSSFTGTSLLLFGTRNETGDVVVVVRGPKNNYMIRKKEQVGGFLWLNRRKQRLYDVPSFYLIASSRPLKEMRNTDLLRQLGIGLGNITVQGKEEFINAFLAHQQIGALYMMLEKISFMDESLFKLVLPFPDNIPRGNYTAEIYLINDGVLTSMQSIPLHVERTGFDAFIFESAQKSGILYGLFAMFMALGIGWGASRIIHKW